MIRCDKSKKQRFKKNLPYLSDTFFKICVYIFIYYADIFFDRYDTSRLNT